MRILVITNLFPPEFLGGYELGCAQMADCLRSRGHEVLVVTSVSPGEDGEQVERVLELPPIYNPDRMNVIGPDMHRSLQVTASAVNPANVRALATIITRLRPDVVYLWNIHGLGGIGILHLLSQQGLAWVWHIMDSIPLQMSRFAVSGSQIASELSEIFPGRYIACSSHILGEIESGGVNLGNKVAVIPNWTHGQPLPRRREFFKRGHLRMMSACGILSEEKGTHIAIETASRLRDDGYSNFTIDLYGRIVGSRFRAMVHEHDVAPFVRLMGSRPHAEILELYSDYDVFIFPTWDREPAAFAPLEAASAGCVPLFSAGCGNAEWMIDGVDCIKAPRDAISFAIAVERILCGDLDLEALGRRAQSVAWREFHISRAANTVERILLDAAADRRPPRGPVSDAYDFARFAEGVVQVLVAEG